MVDIYTSQYRYTGDDRIDTTVKTSDGVFAPTWDMVMRHKKGQLSDEQYIRQYYQLMQKSYINNRSVWEEILRRERVTFVCFCKAGDFCHRKVLAKIFQKQLGAAYKGEI